MKKLLILLSVLFFTSCNQLEMSTVTLQLDEGPITIEVELARSEKDLRSGLMERESMADDHGMLFIFSDEAPRSFWMKNTILPLDIIFIDHNFKIVHIEHHAQPCLEENVECPLYSTEQPAKYVLEVNADLSEKWGIKDGDVMDMDI